MADVSKPVEKGRKEREPDYETIRKSITEKFAKTLAYLAKDD